MGARKPPMMTGFQAEENLTGRAKKMCEKFWTLSDGCQVQKPMLYGDVCNVDGPRLAGAFDIHVFEQIRENLSLLLPFGKVHLYNGLAI